MYNAIRVFIAGYVWMTGFGNFSYYYKTGNFSVGRCGPLSSVHRVNAYPLPCGSVVWGLAAKASAAPGQRAA